MTKQTTITINGRLYDAITGQPVGPSVQQQQAQAQPQKAAAVSKPVKSPARTFSDIGPSRSVAQPPQPVPKRAPISSITPEAKPAAPAKPHAQRSEHPGAHAVHARPQKSQTLYRKALKKPVVEHPEASMTTKQLQDRSPMISKFGTGPLTVHPDLTRKAKAQAEEVIAPAQMHPTVAKVLQQHAPQPAPAHHASGKELKEQLIKERLAEVSDTPHRQPKRAWFKSKPRVASVLTATLALLVLGGYLTYMNLPVISMKVAASRAGVEATFPNYRPDGYALNGPITYSPGEVNINYKSNSNDNGFRITQKPSNWDSQGLLDNYVNRQTEHYLTFQERGVTVYTFGNKAAWVNGGLLYTLEGNASLSSDQVIRLATSM